MVKQIITSEFVSGSVKKYTIHWWNIDQNTKLTEEIHSSIEHFFYISILTSLSYYKVP